MITLRLGWRNLWRNKRRSLITVGGIAFAFAFLIALVGFGRGLDRGRADRFVGMYVNEWTRSYGEKGREAVRLLLDRAFACGAIPSRVTPEWVGPE